MAQRNLLHVNKLDDFMQWLIADGWESQNPVGEWEVLRAVKKNRKHPIIIYKRASSNKKTQLTHFSVRKMDTPVVRAYLRANQKRKLEQEKTATMLSQESFPN